MKLFTSSVKLLCLVSLPIAIGCAPTYRSANGTTGTGSISSALGSGSGSSSTGSSGSSGSSSSASMPLGGASSSVPTVSNGTSASTPPAGGTNVNLNPNGTLSISHTTNADNQDTVGALSQTGTAAPAAPSNSDLQLVVINAPLWIAPNSGGCGGNPHSYHAFGLPVCPSGYIAVSVAANCQQALGGNLLTTLLLNDASGGFVDCCVVDNNPPVGYVTGSQVACAKKAF